MFGETTHGEAGEATLDEVACGKVSDAVLIYICARIGCGPSRGVLIRSRNNFKNYYDGLEF